MTLARMRILTVFLIGGVESAQPQTRVFDGQVNIRPGQSYSIKFTAPRHSRCRLSGTVQARGGIGNDIRVIVSRDAGTSPPDIGVIYGEPRLIYDSGQTSATNLDVAIKPGKYYLLLDNGFSRVTQKSVTGTVYLSCGDRDSIATLPTEHGDASARPSDENPSERPRQSNEKAPEVLGDVHDVEIIVAPLPEATESAGISQAEMQQQAVKTLQNLGISLASGADGRTFSANVLYVTLDAFESTGPRQL